jgi:hypothetical protein
VEIFWSKRPELEELALQRGLQIKGHG